MGLLLLSESLFFCKRVFAVAILFSVFTFSIQDYDLQDPPAPQKKCLKAFKLGL